MNIFTHVGLNFSQVPTSAEDIHICYLQYTIYKSFMIASDLHFIHHNRRQ